MAEIEGIVQLDEFVAETIKQIIKGVKSTQRVNETSGAQIIPSSTHRIQPIEFDIAITAYEQDKSEGKTGTFIGVIGASVKGTTNVSASTVSRIQFTIPVKFPFG